MTELRVAPAGPAEAGPASPGNRSRRLAAAAGGPVLVVAAVLAVLHDVAFRGMVTDQHPDLLAFWLPTHCFLGQSLAAGRIPGWNPHVLAGAPFAADPQSGWLYVPAMLLYAALPCHVALRVFVVLQPVLAGLGLLGFLRSEGLSRPAAAAGGVALALAVSGSLLAVTLPFSASLAWTAILLLSASRFLRAGMWSGRLGWSAAMALAWGQLFAAHPTNGLVLGTGALVAYLATRLSADVRRRRRPGREALLLSALAAGAILAVNLGPLLPRLAYVPRTTMGAGFRALDEMAARLGGLPAPPPRVGPGAPLAWPLQLAVAPGLYLGAGVLGLSFASWWTRRHRSLAVAFSAVAVVAYLLSLEAVAGALEPALRRVPLADLYLHSPWRFRLGLLVALPVLAAIGVDAWRDARGWPARASMLAPGVAAFGVLPLLVTDPSGLGLLAAGAVAVGAVLVVARRRPAVMAVLPVVMAAELSVAGLLGQAQDREAGFPEFAPEGTASVRPFTNLVEPAIPAAAYVEAGPMVEALRSLGTARFLSMAPEAAGRPRGLLLRQDPAHWGLVAHGRATLFGLEDAQGYNPVQLLTYWAFVRAANDRPVVYNAALFREPGPAVLDLLHVAAVVAPAGEPPMPGTRQAAREGRWALYPVPDPAPRASLATAWQVATSPEEALRAALGPGFDPRRQAVLEEDPGIPVPLTAEDPGEGRASYRALGPQRVAVEVETRVPAVVVVRNPYDPNWRATVDGRPAEVLAADGFLQAVPVPAGRHAVILAYEDPWVGVGMLGSALSLLALVGGAALARPRAPAPFRRRTPERAR